MGIQFQIGFSRCFLVDLEIDNLRSRILLLRHQINHAALFDEPFGFGDRENALAAFYKIIEEENRPDRPQREFFWYYKAGFNAARLLEDDSKWQPAAVVYQKLASAGGARSDEAKSRLSRLRLEHFLWDQ